MAALLAVPLYAIPTVNTPPYLTEKLDLIPNPRLILQLCSVLISLADLTTVMQIKR